jgi:hypothetical protein
MTEDLRVARRRELMDKLSHLSRWCARTREATRVIIQAYAARPLWKAAGACRTPRTARASPGRPRTVRITMTAEEFLNTRATTSTSTSSDAGLRSAATSASDIAQFAASSQRAGVHRARGDGTARTGGHRKDAAVWRSTPHERIGEGGRALLTPTAGG